MDLVVRNKKKPECVCVFVLPLTSIFGMVAPSLINGSVKDTEEISTRFTKKTSWGGQLVVLKMVYQPVRCQYDWNKEKNKIIYLNMVYR